MFVLAVILLLLIAATSMLLLRVLLPEFIYHWLIAVAGALVAWVVMLVIGLQIPLRVELVAWGPERLFPESPALLVDWLSWPFGVALVTLAIAVIFTDVARAAEADWSSWAGTLVLGALGLFAVLAGNPLTLLIAWMAIDLAELLILLAQVSQSELRERVVLAFSARVFGSLLLIAAVMVAAAQGDRLGFESISARASLLLVLAAGLRLGILPLHVPFFQELPIRRGLGTMSRLVPAASSLILLVRTADGLSAPLEPLILFGFLGLAALAGLFGGLAWFLAEDELDGRPSWILGMASIAVAAAVRAQPSASLAWGLSALFSGGLLFLTSIHDRRLVWISLLGLLGFSALPYTPAWMGATLFSAPFHPLLVVFLVNLSLLLAGYARHALQPGPTIERVERWVWLVYPFGLLLLPLTHFSLGWWMDTGPIPESILSWIFGPVSIAVTALIMFLGYRFWHRTSGLIDFLKNVLSLNWLYRFLWITYRYLARISAFFTSILEGEGGVLWAFLILVLLLSVLGRSNEGG